MKVVDFKGKKGTTLQEHMEEITRQLEEYHDMEVATVSVVVEPSKHAPLWACSNTEDLFRTLGCMEALKITILDLLAEE